MGELRAVQAADTSIASVPATTRSLARDLAALGVHPGGVYLVHTSLSTLGYVVGGAQSVVDALLKSVGSTGTIMMPTFTGDLSEPSAWQNPPVPESWWPILRAEMPAFDPQRSGTREMGRVNELFRTYPDVIRSSHPNDSFAAFGPHAIQLLADHELTSGLGEQSPLARLYDLNGSVVMCGTGHANNTSLHLAEYRSNNSLKRMRTDGAPMMVNGKREWVSYEILDTDDGDFPEIGKAFGVQSGLEIVGPLGAGTGRVMPIRALVDFGAAWMDAQRH